MDLMILRLIVILTILSACTSDKQLSADRKELIGIWQSIPQEASGWSDTYQFFDNGKFIFNYSQMICDNRTFNYSGTWELISKGKLKLTVDSKTILEGGELVPAMGSCGSEFEIEGGEVKYIKLKDIEIRDIQLSAIILDKENRELKTRTLDNKSFWKFGDDPTKYP